MPDERNIDAFTVAVISVSLLTYANVIKDYLLSASRRGRLFAPRFPRDVFSIRAGSRMRKRYHASRRARKRNLL
jgi:hypothetical protein